MTFINLTRFVFSPFPNLTRFVYSLFISLKRFVFFPFINLTRFVYFPFINLKRFILFPFINLTRFVYFPTTNLARFVFLITLPAWQGSSTSPLPIMTYPPDKAISSPLPTRSPDNVCLLSVYQRSPTIATVYWTVFRSRYLPRIWILIFPLKCTGMQL